LTRPAHLMPVNAMPSPPAERGEYQAKIWRVF